MWDELVGQERAVQVLQRAADRPVHAYLVVGPAGSGAEHAARCLAATLIGAADDERARDLVLRGFHPDVVEFEPEGAAYTLADHIRDPKPGERYRRDRSLPRILPESHRVPVEAERKVLILLEAERLRGNQNEPANMLLKTLEEPPPRTALILVTSTPDDLLPTIRSRCSRIDLDPVPAEQLVAALERDGVPSDEAVLAAALAGGQLARARALAGPRAELRRVFAGIPGRIDGTGAGAHALAAELDAAVNETADAVAQDQASELAAFDAEMLRAGYSDRDAQRLRRRIEDRHKRATRRARIDLLLEGITAIESVYRDALAAPGPPLNVDLTRLTLSPRACAEALDSCREARDAFLVNEKGVVRLQYLLLSLPSPRSVG